ncbi:GRIP and coiled-coil domain-containing protein 2-like [Haliotis cracherodii]|uniref:GRIP and coiled-coil domain-containing protein 2-like n=1 Tax=Haliotis cracherodii TaxID=6455 RepID=UPI0039ED620B
MAEAEGADSKMEEAGTKSPASKLDTLSREDLVKFVKKQMVMFQKTKAKVEDLTKKLHSAEGKLRQETAGTHEELVSEIQEQYRKGQ